MTILHHNDQNEDAVRETGPNAEAVTVACANDALIPISDVVETTREMLLADLEDSSIAAWPKMKPPTGGGTGIFTADPIDGDGEIPDADLVIVATQRRRSYHRLSLSESGGGRAPDCASPDGIVGVGVPFDVDGQWSCSSCGNSKYGSAKNGRAQACKEILDLYVLRQGRLLPEVISLPPTSIQPAAQFVLGLKSHGIPIYGALVNLSFRPTTSGGFRYAVAALKFLRRLTPEEFDFSGRCAEKIEAKLVASIAEQLGPTAAA